MTRGTDANAGRSVGLGLFIVQEIARAHAGSVMVTSTDTEGTTFVATLQR
jgi:sigma-B regulation protein RsbU (phosphoserine phosphatase)